MKSDTSPMQRAHMALRCTAHSKRSGILCKNPAVRGWAVCRMHGARGGHGEGEVNPAYKHGVRSKRFLLTRSLVTKLQREEWGEMS